MQEQAGLLSTDQVSYPQFSLMACALMTAANVAPGVLLASLEVRHPLPLRPIKIYNWPELLQR